MKPILNPLALGLLGLWLLLLPAACRSTARHETLPKIATKVTKRSRPLMGTRFEITVASPPGAVPGSAIEKAFARVQEIENLMSEYLPQSAVSRINAEADKHPVPVDPETFAVIQRAIGIGDVTGGAFDISFAALKGLWDFKAERPVLPSPDDVATRLARVGYRQIALDPLARTVVFRRPGMRIGLGGIAKGYAVDAASQVLVDQGFPNHIIDGGGDLMIRGLKGDKPWMLGIRHPRKPDAMLARLTVQKDGAMVTSGDYERFFEIQGVRYHHIMDPKTGYPARGAISVTITAPTAIEADALATGIFVLGPEKGLALAESLENVEALIVDEKMNIRITSGLRSAVTIAPQDEGTGPR